MPRTPATSLVSAKWLHDHLGDPDLLILDASAHLPGAKRDAGAEFGAGHIPGARFLDLASLKDDSSPVPNTLPTLTQFNERMRAIGVQPDQRIVLYDDSMLRSAARAWFVFRMMGVGPVAVLDGGLQAWRDAGYALETGAVPTSPSDYSSEQDDWSKTRSKDDVLANCDTRAEQVVDARDAARFTGETEDAVHGLAGGHIPGARNVFFRDLLNEDGTFKSPDDLRLAFEQAGLDLSKPITASCGSGMTASVLLFALHLIGIDDAALYDGSWSEWGADPATPKETGNAA